MRREPPRHILVLPALVVAAALLFSGCPSKTGTGLVTEATSDDQGSTSSQGPKLDKGKDEKKATAALLSLDDLPGSKWEEPTTPTTENTKSGSSFDCPELGDLFNDADTPSLTRASSPTFEQTQPYGRVANEVIFMADDSAAKAELDDLKAKSDAVRACFERGFSHDFAREGRNVETAVEDWSFGKMGQARVGFSVTLTSDVEVFLGVALVRVGRAATVVVIAQDQPLDQDAADIVQTATDKLSDNLG
ncbi:MAG: hypothetical protein HYX32_13890 [Actinobacteria bacterium]|nr:hypothetical protein [Actinomycetota bacterium]